MDTFINQLLLEYLFFFIAPEEIGIHDDQSIPNNCLGFIGQSVDKECNGNPSRTPRINIYFFFPAEYH